MVDILNLRTSPDGASTPASSPDREQGQAEDHVAARVTSPPPTSSLKDSIVQGLASTAVQVPGDSEDDVEWQYTKTIPTMVLYDHKGLDIYDDITQTDDYYLYNSELSILKTHGADIARRLFASESVHPSSMGNQSNGKRSSSPTGESDGTNDEEHIHDSESGEEGASSEGTEDTGFGSKDSGFQSVPGHKERWGDARVGKNNYGVNGSLSIKDTSTSETTGSVIELGAGSLKKTSVLLQAISSTILSESLLSRVNYFALDLEFGQLVQTLDALEETIPDAVTTTITPASISDEDTKPEENQEKKIVARGICASYDDALPYLKEGKLDNSSTVHSERKNILFLGSSIGNYSREEGADFLKKISDEAMSVGDTLLIGIDGCNDGPRIETAYNDSLGVTRAFILNGVDHVSRILEENIEKGSLSQDQFEYANRYNAREGRHEAYLRAKEDFTLSITRNDDATENIQFKKDELVAIERSYKYTVLEALRLFSSAGLRLVQKWSDDKVTGTYHLYLLEKAPFHFPSTSECTEKGENPFGLVSLDEWDRLWAAWDTVTLSMIPRDLLHTKPIDLRHICLFYLGHIPGFLDIQLSRYTGQGYTEPAHYPEMFERGIDPNMEDPSKVHAHSVVPTKMEDWPQVEEIVEYRNRVRARLHAIYDERLTNKKPEEIDTRLVRVLQMVYEHEAMHLETLLYMCAQIPPHKLNPAPGFTTPDWQSLKSQWRAQVDAEHRNVDNTIITYPESTVEIGHDDFDHLDKQTPYDPAHTFGWDNESPKRTVKVPSFKISLLPISNGDYLKFWEGKTQTEQKELLPGSWAIGDGGSISIKVLTAPSLVPIDVAEAWPLMASGKQLAAYAESVGGRLPTEPELRRYIVDNPVDHIGANIGFANWHPVPARLPTSNRNGSKTGASNGGVWEWCSTEFAAYKGWRTSELYPGYSEDFFDGCHWIMLGGSFATIPRIAGRRTFTNWYQAGYPYVFAGARVAYDMK